jgi:hypothetical protein
MADATKISFGKREPKGLAASSPISVCNLDQALFSIRRPKAELWPANCRVK